MSAEYCIKYVVNAHDGVLLSYKNFYEILTPASKWMQLGIIMLSEITQTQNKNHIFSYTFYLI